MQRSQQAQPIYRYSSVLSAALAAAFAAAWLLVALAVGLPGVVPFAGKLAASLFLGLLATVLWLDFGGYATLRGLIDWHTAQEWMMWAGVIGLLITFPLVVGIYVVRALRDSRRGRAAGTRSATPPTRFRTTPIGLATLAGVTLLALLLSTVGLAATTRVANAQGPGTNGGQDTISPPAQPTTPSAKNQKPAKGKKGRGHHGPQG
jgi:hypothetical protein